MSSTMLASESRAKLADVREIASRCGCSQRTVARLSKNGAMPRPIRLGRLVRWRLRTGDPATGVEDWIDAECPTLSLAV